MQKNAATMQEPLANSFAVGPIIRGIISKVRNVVRIEIPIGYQDAAGFHFGVKPPEKGIQWPPNW